MSEAAQSEGRVGPYSGTIAEAYRTPDLLAALADLPALLRAPQSAVLTAGRNRNVKIRVPRGGAPCELVVKVFAAEGALKNWLDFRRGSKARRTWLTAVALQTRGVGTPPPVGFLERWDGRRLAESYFLSEYVGGLTSFREELIRLFREDPVCEKFMALLQTVADAVRGMHAAGVLHNDLGNQNILLRRTGEARWADVQFVDLNRAAVRAALSARERARDISRIHLPSDFLRVFKEMYYGGPPPPPAFLRWERWYRQLYAAHCATRVWRHPWRTARRRRAEAGKPDYPAPREQWVWDERSGQAVSTLLPRDRGRYRRRGDAAAMARAAAAAAWGLRRAYRELLGQCYAAPVDLRSRVCVALEPRPQTWAREAALLDALGPIPTLLRFYHHEGPAQWDFRARALRDLRERGHTVAVALVQDRRAVREPERWRAFVERVLDDVGELAQWVEAGHAVNRVKWGVWNLAEQRRLLRAAVEAAGRHAAVRLTGPAAIDFDFPYVLAALRQAPEGFRLWALSHHLYVDRRGGPEGRQAGFGALEKLALARAIARGSPACEDRLIVSEVNWPLAGTGVYSPVGSPYVSPGPRRNDPSVSEDEYADYMLRYLTAALCSGLAHQVCWWRLAAHGYGLVDDAGEPWRERPAYGMLRQFLNTAGAGTFVGRLAPPAREGGGEFLFFETAAGRVCLATRVSGAGGGPMPVRYAEAADAFGRPLRDAAAALGRRPIYLLGCEAPAPSASR